MTVRLLIATTNPGKVRELRALLGELDVLVVTPPDVGLALDVVENGATFEANAVLKARAFAAATGLPALADDSGLEVDALGGEPGVRSARWVPGSDGDRVAALLARLDGVPTGAANGALPVGGGVGDAGPRLYGRRDRDRRRRRRGTHRLRPARRRRVWLRPGLPRRGRRAGRNAYDGRARTGCEECAEPPRAGGIAADAGDRGNDRPLGRRVQ